MKKLPFFILIFLLLATCAAAQGFTKQLISEGEEKVYAVNDYFYFIKLVSVSDTEGKLQFQVNDELTDFIEENQIYDLEDGSAIVPMQVLVDEGGADIVQFNFYPEYHWPGETSGHFVSQDMEVPVTVMMGAETHPSIKPFEEEKIQVEPTVTEGKVSVGIIGGEPKEEPKKSFWYSIGDWFDWLFRR